MRQTATHPVNIEALKILAKQYNAAKHSKEAQHAGNQVMLMLDAIIARLEAK